MKAIQATIGILMVIGLSLGIVFGVYQTHDGKNLRDFAELYSEAAARAEASDAAAAAANRRAAVSLKQAREDRERLASLREYVLGLIADP